jgi:hypothetical protein
MNIVNAQCLPDRSVNRLYDKTPDFCDFEVVPIMNYGGGTLGFRNMLARDPEYRLCVIILTHPNDTGIHLLNRVFGRFLARLD